MYGDAGTGFLGFNELASLNPGRWSGAISINEGVANLGASLKQGDRPIIVKVPAVRTGQRFETTQAAIDFLESVDPKRVAAKAARAVVAEKERILADSKKTKKACHDALNEALEASGKNKWKRVEWMYADAALGNISRLNPVRWSGSQTFRKTIDELADLIRHSEEKGEAQRPITLKSPHFHAVQDFVSCQAAIDFLVGDGVEALDVPENAHVRAKEHLEDAEKQLKEAVALAEIAEADLAAAA
jgi:hypothetical protein